MAERKVGFRSNCKICTAKDKNGDEIRPQVETMKSEGKTYAQIQEVMIEKGIILHMRNLTLHFKNHAPYVEKGVALSKETKRAITQITHSSEAAKQALNKIIQMGSEMIDNWWEGKDGPKMPITQKMFIAAIQEEGKRAPKTALDEDFEKLTQQAIEGEVQDAEQITN